MQNWFKFTPEQVAACEAELHFDFPAAYKSWLIRGDGIELEIDGCSWFLFPVIRDDQDSPRDVGTATRAARELPGWPAESVCVGYDGGGGKLFLARRKDGTHELGFFGGRYGRPDARRAPIESSFRRVW